MAGVTLSARSALGGGGGAVRLRLSEQLNASDANASVLCPMSSSNHYESWLSFDTATAGGGDAPISVFEQHELPGQCRRVVVGRGCGIVVLLLFPSSLVCVVSVDVPRRRVVT